jgi:xanthine dehydrogenase iron-sulfur cluster and FAD-binding subunit A
MRLYELESFVIGKTLEDIRCEETLSIIRKTVTPISDLHAEAEYRRKVAGKVFLKLLEDIFNSVSCNKTGGE